MATVRLGLPNHAYEIRIGAGVLGRLGKMVREVAPHQRCALLADRTVYRLYGSAVRTSLEQAGYVVTVEPFKAGEANKNLRTVARLYDILLNDKLERRSPVIALGGGVTGDTVGFVAATYLRGVPFVQCPTTLLAMVDSSVGGKVGVNVAQGKNLIGAFYQPVLVVIDPEALRTLPAREFRCGLAECVKHGLLGDAALFEWIESNLEKIVGLDMEILTRLVEWNVRIKANIVTQDEKESGVRSLLNLGHTFGHAIEATSGYGVIEHGEAVALGLVAAAHLSAATGRCDGDVPRRVRSLLERIGLPVQAKLAPTNDLMQAMTLDKKVSHGRVRLILLDAIGRACLASEVDEESVVRAWEVIRAED